MPERGPLPKPVAHRRPNEAPPTPVDPATVPPPSWLSEGGREVWDSEAPALMEVGRLTPVDARLFGVLCDMFARYHELGAFIASGGVMVSGIDGPAVNVALVEQRRMVAAITPIAAKFGLTPGDRIRVFGAGPHKSEPAATERRPASQGGRPRRKAGSLRVVG